MVSILSILLASLLGSPHCAAMCGGFVGIAAQSSKPRYAQLGYHLGRLTTYLTLGAVAGFLGEAINRFGIMLGINRAAAVLTGILLIVSALSMLFGARLGLARLIPRQLMQLSHLLLAQSSRNARFQGFFLGLFSTLLPCGWLYTYVAIAGASASILQGMAIMVIFWVGTLPILLTIGSISHLIATPFRKHIPTFVAVLMLLAGIFAITGHLASVNPSRPTEIICEH